VFLYDENDFIGEFYRLATEFRAFNHKRFFAFIENKIPTVVAVGVFTFRVVVMDFYFVVVEDDLFHKRADELSRLFLDRRMKVFKNIFPSFPTALWWSS